jgi:hypothetical protein
MGASVALIAVEAGLDACRAACATIVNVLEIGCALQMASVVAGQTGSAGGANACCRQVQQCTMRARRCLEAWLALGVSRA